MIPALRHPLLGLLLAAMPCSAQEIAFKAALDRHTATTGEYVRLTITLSNAQGNITTPDLGGLAIVQGPMTQSSNTFINGRYMRSSTFQWVLTATRPGKYTIGPSEVRVGGGVLRTEPLHLEVTKAPASGGDPAVLQGQGRDPNFFLTLTLNKNKGYVGEQLIATYSLYTRYTYVHPVNEEMPRITGFWAEDLERPAQAEQRIETINGLQYRVFTLKRQLLIPQRTGKLRIEPFSLSCIVERTMISRGNAVDARSNAVEFTSLELPSPPAGNIGAVGDLQLSMAVGRKQLKANEALELTVKLSGRGNLRLIDAPKLALPPGVEAFDPKITDKVTVNASGMSGSREFQYLLVPRVDGALTLGPVAVPVFDPRAAEWRTLRSGEVGIEVEPGDPAAANAVVRGLEVRELDRDIRYIRTGDLALREHGRTLFGSVAWYAGMATPALAFVLLLGWRRRAHRLAADPVAVRRSRADKQARAHLREAAKALDLPDREPFHAALSKALHGYAQDKLGIGPAELDAATLTSRFAALPDAEAAATDYLRLIEACAMARFAPLEEQPRRALYEEAAALITRIEQYVRA